MTTPVTSNALTTFSINSSYCIESQLLGDEFRRVRWPWRPWRRWVWSAAPAADPEWIAGVWMTTGAAPDDELEISQHRVKCSPSLGRAVDLDGQ
jgi:hypothetical protein